MYKFGYLTKSSKDNEEHQVSQVQNYGNRSFDVAIYTPYGFCSNAPVGSYVSIFDAHQQEGSRLGLSDFPQLRFQNLRPYEVQVGNYKTRDSIFFSNDNKIVIDAPESDIEIKAAKTISLKADLPITIESATSISLKAPQCTSDLGGSGVWTINGKVNIQNDLQVGAITSFLNHKHSGVNTGASNTGNPV